MRANRLNSLSPRRRPRPAGDRAYPEAMVPRHGAALALAALAILIGCQGCSSNEVSMDTFAVEFPRDYCALAYRCCTPADVDQFFFYGTPSGTAEDCSDILHHELARYAEILRMRLAPIAYDGQRAQACLTRLSTMTCADLVKFRTDTLEPALPCFDVFTNQGNQPVGARCVFQYDCQAGLACL